MKKMGKKFDFIKKLWENGESATLTMDNLKDVSDFTLDEDFEILTCENESPFNSLKRKSKKSGNYIYFRISELSREKSS